MADPRERVEVSEAEVAVHWKEEEFFYPSRNFIAQANMTDEKIYERFSLDNFPDCFKEYADLLDWYQYWHTTLDTSDAPCWKWFVGGKINACYNCVDRHLAKHRNKAALIFVPEPEEEPPVAVTYQDLFVRVNEFAALLRDFAGLKAGDRVTIHMPMVPELPITMLACARLGVIHSVVFGGFSGHACGDRVADSKSHVIVTMDAYYRNGQTPRPQAEGRRGDQGRGGGRAEGGQGARLEEAPGEVLVGDAHGGRARLLHRRSAA